MLRAVVNEGTGGRVRRLYGITADMGGKTGTTNRNSDAVSYTHLDVYKRQTLPVRSGYLVRRSTSMEWLSVPPETIVKPRSIKALSLIHI